MKTHARLTFVAALLASVLAAPGCVPLVATGAAVGTLAALDRRTLGAQTEDQEIEIKAMNRMREALKQPGGVSVTSFNRKVLLTGQVASEDDKRSAEAVVAALPNVRSVHNELQVLGRPSLATSAADTAITARVKKALLDAQDLHANVIKVVTESGTVYLMGLVSRREADRAAQVTSRVAGVQRVVTVFEYITEEQARRTPAPPPQ
ncbi:MAG: BON domain-containing protein [Lautropia sp.]|nr:MAG: BON domain-containing protein [Pseudomonadota bacterium]MBC6960289.1 BON domain-containing protein [Lautropia sp.]MCL4701986.1 BON domain-containing protein [Burkholderiaceae bacterium]MDL1906084.1 BON domain-containing protein [Betaproteobacteria bacterium PRO1]MEB2335907.1 BON domain-containing protein [Burkholderiales bacterium]